MSLSKSKRDITHNILQDFVERAVLADMDKDISERYQLRKEVIYFITSFRAREEESAYLKREMLTILQGSDDPAMELFYDIIEMYL